MSCFGERLRALRTAAGMTQGALGEMIKKSDSAVRMWELGRNEPDMKTLSALSAILGCSLEYLMCRDGGGVLAHAPGDIPVYLPDDLSGAPLRYIASEYKSADSGDYFAVLYPYADMLPVIRENDCVIFRKQDSTLGGGLALIKKSDGTCRIRKLVYQPGGVILTPLSPDFEPDYFPAEEISGAFLILGAAVELRRSLE